MKVLTGMEIDFKVLSADTGGALLVLENSDSKPGGPPKHVHHDQEEWFYVIEGSYVFEIGDEKFQLGPGDSVLAPRKVPHVWAHVGEGTGRILVGFQPAGQMEEFFEKLSKVQGPPDNAAMAKLFRDHGMEVLGPPLTLSFDR